MTSRDLAQNSALVCYINSARAASLPVEFTTKLAHVTVSCRWPTQIDGREAGTVRSRALCESLQTIYMGPDPVAPDAKASFAEGIARMLED